MPHDYFWALFGVSFILALLVLGLVGHHLGQSRKIKLRAIQKEERLKAIEAGVPLPEVENVANGTAGLAASSEEALSRQVRWLRLLSLAFGCFLLFAGLGMWLAFSIVDDEGLREVAAIGLLPALAGIGLLLFYWVTRERH